MTNGRKLEQVQAWSGDAPFARKVKSWLWIAIWTFVGAVVGTVLAYILFGIAYTGWGVLMEKFATPGPARTGDPIDTWAVGIVGMMMALPVVLAGFIGGAVVGFRFGRRRHH
jgi:hypothetical protein